MHEHERQERQHDAERISASRGVRSVTSISGRCRARPRPRTRPCRPATGAAGGGLGRQQPLAALQHQLEVVLRVVVLRVERGLLEAMTAASSSSERSCCCAPWAPSSSTRRR